MAKVFTSEEFIKKLKWLVNDVPNVYYSGSQWSKLNSQGQWQFDCVVSIKSILWGFRADPNALRGGTVYCSNDVPDFPCDAIYQVCSDVSQDFNNLVPGEYLCMKDTGYNHSGIYLGNGKVFEDTTGWGVKRAIISNVSNTGTRSLNGVTNLRWTYHGKLKYIDYSQEPTPPSPTPTQKFKIGDKVVINGDLYVSSNADNPNGHINNKVTYITRYNPGSKHPYNTTGDLGWMNENDIKLYVDNELKVGDTVKIIATGNGSSYGDSNIAYGIGWTEKILKIYPGRAYPYQVGDDKSTIGFYQKSALQKMK